MAVGTLTEVIWSQADTLFLLQAVYSVPHVQLSGLRHAFYSVCGHMPATSLHCTLWVCR
jgi:hypothetical protein